jgi:hypothetical protein
MSTAAHPEAGSPANMMRGILSCERIASIMKLLLFALTAVVAGSAQNVLSLARLKTYSQERISSYDRSGANDDGGRANMIKPGETREIGNVQGPGVITHIWFTIATPEPYHLKKIVIRMYWDAESLPGGRGADRRFLRPRRGRVLPL